MHRPPLPAAVTAVLFAACHSYTPAPVDLPAHAREFAARLQHLPAQEPRPHAGRTWNPADGVDAWEARQLALLFHPDCRAARSHADVARIVAAESGRLPDPELGIDVERILESVPHPWLVGANVGFTVPLSGRLSAERDLAESRHGAAIAAALAVEQDVMSRTDLAFARWTAVDRRTLLLEQLIRSLAELEAIAVRLAEAGELTHAGARAFTLERVQRDAELRQERGKLTAAVLDLKRMTGLPPAALVTFVPSAGQPPHGGTHERRTELLFSSLRLLALRRDHDIAERALALAVREQWPDLRFAPGFAEEDAQPRVTLGLSLPLPLFSGNIAAIRSAEADRDRAAEALRAGYETLVHDLAAAEARLSTADDHRAFVERELVPLAEKQVDDCRRLAELGQLDPLLILDALVRDHDAKARTAEARLAVDEAVVALNALFTGEWDGLTEYLESLR